MENKTTLPAESSCKALMSSSISTAHKKKKKNREKKGETRIKYQTGYIQKFNSFPLPGNLVNCLYQ